MSRDLHCCVISWNAHLFSFITRIRYQVYMYTCLRRWHTYVLLKWTIHTCCMYMTMYMCVCVCVCCVIRDLHTVVVWPTNVLCWSQGPWGPRDMSRWGSVHTFVHLFVVLVNEMFLTFCWRFCFNITFQVVVPHWTESYSSQVLDCLYI